MQEFHRNDTPRVSVVMPVFNEERHLVQALESLLQQTFRDFEIVVVDDASTDRTPAILAKLQARDSRIRILTNEENRGPTPSLNIGLRAARGEFIARMDGDDICLPDRLRAQVEFLDTHSDIVVLGTGRYRIDDSGHVHRFVIESTTPWEFAWISLFRSPIAHPTAMFRAWLVREKGLYYDENCRTAQDMDLWVRMQDHGKGASLPERLLFYRIHPNSVSSSRSAEQHSTARDNLLRHLFRRYPEFEAHRDLLTWFYDLQFRKAPSGDRSFCEVFDAMALIESRFLRDHELTPRERRRQRKLAARWLMVTAMRNERKTRLALLRAILWRGRPYWLGFASEIASYAGRRVSRLSRPVLGLAEPKLPAGTDAKHVVEA